MTTERDDLLADIIRDQASERTAAEQELAQLFAAVMRRARDEYDGEAGLVIATLRAAGWRPPAEHGDHEIAWTLDADSVLAEAVCHAGSDAVCRVTCGEGCEEWFAERDEQGWFHSPGTHEEVIKHRLAPTKDGTCNVVEFMNNGDDLSEIGHSQGRGLAVIGSLPIETNWEGDYYSWKVADGGEPHA